MLGMFGKRLNTIATLGYLASLRPRWRRFQHALAHPERVQSQRLLALLRRHGQSAYGRAVKLHRLRSVQDYQARVPIVGWDELAPWLRRVEAGEPNVLTASPVRMLEITSGSTSGNKLIPYTTDLLEELEEATGPWLYDLYAHHRGLWGTRAYWSISPATQRERRTRGGLPIGFQDDTEYFSGVGRWVLGRLMVAPPNLGRAQSVESWHRETVRCLLRADDLGLISVWSPSFLEVLLRGIDADWPQWAQGLPGPRRAAVEQRRSKGASWAEALWPRLQVISCWTDGPAAAGLEALRPWLGAVPVQGKGLLATEGVVSIPLSGSEGWNREGGSVLAVGSHFLEFMDVQDTQAPPRLAHQLRLGAEYTVLLTTGGGLWRYHLKDVIQCVGKIGATPVIRFCGKLDGVSDKVGEKLGPSVVQACLDAARAECGLEYRFALVAPEREGALWRYRLWVEGQSGWAPGAASRLRDATEARLLRCHHYQVARNLGQLAPLAVSEIQDGWERYTAALVAQGKRLGDIKPTALVSDEGWGARLNAPAQVPADVSAEGTAKVSVREEQHELEHA